MAERHNDGRQRRVPFALGGKRPGGSLLHCFEKPRMAVLGRLAGQPLKGFSPIDRVALVPNDRQGAGGGHEQQGSRRGNCHGCQSGSRSREGLHTSDCTTTAPAGTPARSEGVGRTLGILPVPSKQVASVCTGAGASAKNGRYGVRAYSGATVTSSFDTASTCGALIRTCSSA